MGVRANCTYRCLCYSGLQRVQGSPHSYNENQGLRASRLASTEHNLLIRTFLHIYEAPLTKGQCHPALPLMKEACSTMHSVHPARWPANNDDGWCFLYICPRATQQPWEGVASGKLQSLRKSSRVRNRQRALQPTSPSLQHTNNVTFNTPKPEAARHNFNAREPKHR